MSGNNKQIAEVNRLFKKNRDKANYGIIALNKELVL